MKQESAIERLRRVAKEVRLRLGVRVSEIMRPRHPRWREFRNQLSGPGFCDFRYEREDDPKSFRFNCKGSRDKTFAKRLLRKMGFTKGQIEASCAYFETRGGFCDCEILFNVEPRRPRRRKRA